MTDLEKELVKKLCECDAKNGYVCVLHREVLPLIHSHAQALVAAAYAACADAASQDAQVIVTSLGNMESGDATGEELDRAMKAAMNIRPRLCKLTPADATWELERRELEGVRWIWEQDFADAYNGGYLTERGRELVQKRIASLSKPAPVERSNEND